VEIVGNENKALAKYTFDDIVGDSKEIEQVKEIAKKASNSSSPILMYGETGTGKELFVQAIHNHSKRQHKEFIAQNCAAIPEGLLESLLFGSLKGGFTGAESRKGLFEIADGGTLYLDELNSMPLEFQGKLLRTLQEGIIRRVGDTTPKKVDVRIIASINEEPEELLLTGKLRKDLFYRLNVMRIDLPSLRHRKEDIPLLIQFFIKKFNSEFEAKVEGIDEKALEKLILSPWRGNVRQLEHVIEAAFNLRQAGNILIEDLNIQALDISLKQNVSLVKRLEEAERTYIKEALIISGYNVSKAAKYLDIPRQTLQYKLKKFNDISEERSPVL
jgi:transcriptional regulator with PAS, ATPase and Fis domain